MDKTSLQAFIQVADLASFSLAAEQLHLTQPAISKRIANLETQLEQRLFDRIGRQLLLTEAGAILLPRARTILTEIRAAEQLMQNLTGAVGGRIKLAASHHFGLHYLPPVLRAFRARHPKVELDMHFVNSEIAYKAVGQGDYDLALITLPNEIDPQLKVAQRWSDPLAFMISRQSDLSADSLEALSQHPAVLPNQNTFTYQIVAGLFAQRHLQVPNAMATDYLETIKMMVSVNLGWSVLPRSMLDDQLREIALPGIAMQRWLGVLHHRQRTLSNAAQALLEELAKSADVKSSF